MTDAAGVEVRRQDHTPFGDQHYAWGSHAESKGWIGEREEETELVYLNARYYDPEIGRFTAPDPTVRLGQKLNRYSYSRNNPINLSDPSGLDECTGTSTGPTNGGVSCTLDGPSSAVVPLRLPDELPPPAGLGIPLNALLDFFTDARADLEALAEQDVEALAALRTMLDNTLFAVKAAATQVNKTTSEGAGGNTTGGGGGGGGGGGDPGREPSPETDDSGFVGVASFGFSGFAGVGATGGVDAVWFPDDAPWIPGEVAEYDFGGAGVGVGNLYGLHGGASLEFGVGVNIHSREDYFGAFSVVQFSLPGYGLSVAWAGGIDDPITITVGPALGTVGVSYTEQEYVPH